MSSRHVTKKTSKVNGGKGKLRNLFDDLSFSEDDTTKSCDAAKQALGVSQVPQQEASFLDLVLSKAKAKKSSRDKAKKPARKPLVDSSNVRNTAMSNENMETSRDDSKHLYDALEHALSKAKKARPPVTGRYKETSYTSSIGASEKGDESRQDEEIASLTQQLDSFLISAAGRKKKPIKTGKKTKKPVHLFDSNDLLSSPECNAVYSPQGSHRNSPHVKPWQAPGVAQKEFTSSTLLQTFVMDSDSSKENDDPEKSDSERQILAYDSAQRETTAANAKDTSLRGGEPVLVIEDSFLEESHTGPSSQLTSSPSSRGDQNEVEGVCSPATKPISLKVSPCRKNMDGSCGEDPDADEHLTKVAGSSVIRISRGDAAGNQDLSPITEKRDASFSSTDESDNGNYVKNASLQASFCSSDDVRGVDKQPVTSAKDISLQASFASSGEDVEIEKSLQNVSLQATFQNDEDESLTSEQENQATFQSDDEASPQKSVSLQVSVLGSAGEEEESSDTSIRSSEEGEPGGESESPPRSKGRKLPQTAESRTSPSPEEGRKSPPRAEGWNSSPRAEGRKSSPRAEGWKSSPRAEGRKLSPRAEGRKPSRCPQVVSLSDSDDSFLNIQTAVKQKVKTSRGKTRTVGDSVNHVDRKNSAESESSGSDLEAFFDRMKRPAKQFVTSPQRSEDSGGSHSMDDFVVPDDEVSMEDSPAFYLHRDRKLRERTTATNYRESAATGSDEITTDESDISDSSSGEDYGPSFSDSSDLEIVPTKKLGANSKRPDNHDRKLKEDRRDDSDSEESGSDPDSTQQTGRKRSDRKAHKANKARDVNSEESDFETTSDIAEGERMGSEAFQTCLGDENFELPDLDTSPESGKSRKSANGRIADKKKGDKRDKGERLPVSLSAVDSDDDFDNSVFKTPTALIVRPKQQPRSVFKPAPGAAHGLSVPARKPVSRVDVLAEKSASVARKSACSFLQSLSDDMQSHRRHPEADRYVKNFKKLKEDLTVKLFRMYNESVFDSKLPNDFNVKWNVRLTKSAGYCAYKRSAKTGDRASASRIELSVKVCDRAERLRDTLMHEMCHAAVWVVHGVSESHGPYWKHYARKANRVFPELAVVERCHNYKIECKYTYRCTSCGYEIGRHSKSLDTDKKVCGYCRAPFQLLVNTSSRASSARSSGADSSLASSLSSTPRTPNRFAMFVKENYGSVKQAGSLSHGEVMRQLSKEFAAKNKLS